MRIPQLLRDLIPADKWRTLTEMANQEAIIERLRDVAAHVGFKPSSETLAAPIREVKQAVRHVRWWIDSLANRVRSENLVRLHHGINATGKLFISDWVAPLATQESITAYSVAASGFCDARNLRSTTERELAELLQTESVLLTQSIEAALLLLSANEFQTPSVDIQSQSLAAGKWLIRAKDLIRLPSGGNLGTLLTSSGRIKLREVGASNACTFDDWREAVEAGAASGAVIVVDEWNSAEDIRSLQLVMEFLRQKKIVIVVVSLIGNAHSSTAVTAEDATVTKTESSTEPSAESLKLFPSIFDLLDSKNGVNADIAISVGNGLIGGPFCGFVAGRETFIDSFRRTARELGLTADGATLAAMSAAIKVNADFALWSMSPVGQILMNSPANLQSRAKRMAVQLQALPNVKSCETLDRDFAIGNDAWRNIALPSTCLRLQHRSLDVDAWQTELRSRAVPLYVATEADSILIVMRTFSPDDDQEVVDAIEDCE